MVDKGLVVPSPPPPNPPAPPAEKLENAGVVPSDGLSVVSIRVKIKGSMELIRLFRTLPSLLYPFKFCYLLPKAEKLGVCWAVVPNPPPRLGVGVAPKPDKPVAGAGVPNVDPNGFKALPAVDGAGVPKGEALVAVLPKPPPPNGLGAGAGIFPTPKVLEPNAPPPNPGVAVVAGAPKGDAVLPNDEVVAPNAAGAGAGAPKADVVPPPKVDPKVLVPVCKEGVWPKGVDVADAVPNAGLVVEPNPPEEEIKFHTVQGVREV